MCVFSFLLTAKAGQIFSNSRDSKVIQSNQKKDVMRKLQCLRNQVSQVTRKIVSHIRGNYRASVYSPCLSSSSLHAGNLAPKVTRTTTLIASASASLTKVSKFFNSAQARTRSDVKLFCLFAQDCPNVTDRLSIISSSYLLCLLVCLLVCCLFLLLLLFFGCFLCVQRRSGSGQLHVWPTVGRASN